MISVASTPLTQAPSTLADPMDMDPTQRQADDNQRGFPKMENHHEDGKDPLPIVELKPFVKKVWRREKSLPAFYEHFEQLRLAKLMESIPPTPPMPSPDKIEMYLEMTRDKKRGGSAESPRYKVKAHPPLAETKAPKQVEHTHSIVPGFITRKERSKSTLNEIQCAEAASKMTTGLQQSLNRSEVVKPPMINLNDGKVSKTGSKRSLQFISTFRSIYHRHTAWSQTNSDAGYQPVSVQNMYGFNKPDDISRNTTPFYDSFDRKGTLPSINISLKTLKKRIPRSQLGLDDSYEGPGASPLHKVGGISNSLHVLSKIGQPTKFETQLSNQLRIDLRKFRKSKNNYFPFDMSPYELAKYYPPSSVSLTLGEIELRKGLQSNTSKRSKQTRDRSTKSVASAPDKLITSESALQSPRMDDLEDADPEVIRITGYPEGSVRQNGSAGQHSVQEPTQDVAAAEEEETGRTTGSVSPAKRTRSSKRVRTTTLVTMIPVANQDSPASSEINTNREEDKPDKQAASSESKGQSVLPSAKGLLEETGPHSPRADEPEDNMTDNIDKEDHIMNDNIESATDVEIPIRNTEPIPEVDEEAEEEADIDESRVFLTSGSTKVRPAKDDSSVDYKQ